MGIPDLIYCADGNPAFAQAAIEAGWLYGAKIPSTIYHPIYFADQDWKKPNEEKYIKALELHRPRVCTVLDWEHPEQFGEVMRWAERASKYCQKVIIIPKVPGLVEEIPQMICGKEIIIGYSVPTSYGGSPIGLWEIGDRPVHLLGGSPQKQIELANYLRVVSCDGNMAHKQAHKCRAWTPRPGRKGHWQQLSDIGLAHIKEGANLAAFCTSMKNIKQEWNNRS